MKKPFSRLLLIFFLVISLSMLLVFQAYAAGPKVSEPTNKHNLSSNNTIPGFLYKASGAADNPRGKQICIFCHTPHSANVIGQAPLWNRTFSTELFQRYTSLTLKIRGITDAKYGEGALPNGSSKLCLSCHDGVSRLGAIYSGSEIVMEKANPVIEGVASFKPDTNKMWTGHHPVSFVYTDAIASTLTGLKGTTYKMPTAVPAVSEVKLDKQSRMQCTTCHDAHQNMSSDTDMYLPPNETRKIAPFWVYGVNNNGSADQQTVCMACHPMNAGVGFVGPWAYPAPPAP
jgi:hypothetical protein